MQRAGDRAGSAALAAVLLVALLAVVAAWSPLAAAPKFPGADGPRRRRGRPAQRRRPPRADAGTRRARGEIHRPARRLHDRVPAGLPDRGVRLPARPRLADRPEGQGQRRHPARRAERAKGAHRGRARAGAAAHRPHDQADHRERHPAGVSPRRFRSRRQGGRARHPRRHARRRGSGEGAGAHGQEALGRRCGLVHPGFPSP